MLNLMKAFFYYSLTSKAYRTFNKITLNIEEFVHVSFYETNSSQEDKVVHFNKDDADDAQKYINNNDEHNEHENVQQEDEVEQQ